MIPIIRIKGNARSRHFAVINYGADGEQINLLVNTTDPYEGTRPLDFMEGEHTTRLEIKSEDDWEFEILPISEAPVLNVPGTIEGNGDDVIILSGAKPDLAKIVGNSGSKHFAVIGYGESSDLLVNTTDPYEGTVIVDSSTAVLEVDAEGNWSIEVTSK